MKLERAKGVRDFPPEEKILRNDVVERLKGVFELYGYNPLETPIIERLDLVEAKAGAGEEADAAKETFKFLDQGNRNLALRFELTLSFARYIGMNPTLKMPFKRYELGPVFRDGPIKLGRYRQFWQCDVDAVGCKDVIMDAEMIALALDCFKALELDAYIELNNRKLLKGIIKWAGIKDSLADSVIISIDKLAKIGKQEVMKELEDKKIEDTQIAKLMSAFDVRGTSEEKLEMLKSTINNQLAKEGLKEIEDIFSYLSDEQKKNVIFNVGLARGLGYYTGPIFEGYLRKSKITSSICGGGRYDNMIPMLIGGTKEYPAVGISFGLDVITDAMKLSTKEMVKTVTQIYIIPIKTQKECFQICKQLRDMGVKADMDMLGRSISKNLQYANSMTIPYSLFVGSDELKQGKVKLRNMASGEEKLVKVKDVLSSL